MRETENTPNILVLDVAPSAITVQASSSVDHYTYTCKEIDEMFEKQEQMAKEEVEEEERDCAIKSAYSYALELRKFFSEEDLVKPGEREKLMEKIDDLLSLTQNQKSARREVVEHKKGTLVAFVAQIWKNVTGAEGTEKTAEEGDEDIGAEKEEEKGEGW